MRLGKYGKILHVDNVTLGSGTIKRLTLFELKWIGGVIINVFNTKYQDRFHTHAFSAYSWMVRGFYKENVLDSFGNVSIYTSTPGLRFIPKSYNHQILNSSPNAVSITIMGPWEKIWTETHSDTRKVRKYSWGRFRV